MLNRPVGTEETMRPEGRALLPLVIFLGIFLGSGIYFNLQDAEYAFYQIAAPVAALPAVLASVLMDRRKVNATIESFLKGVGNPNIMAMCMIFLMAGAFSSVAKATGGVDATVGLALQVIPAQLLLPGLFIVAAFISTAMGTSMGTIAALAPIALGVAESSGLSIPLVGGTILGGAMFGDNLSIISDTTIAATRSQGCHMKDKFRANFAIAAPAAVVTLLLLLFVGGASSVTPPEAGHGATMIPYLVILGLALSGVNVFVVLAAGLALAGAIGMAVLPEYSLVQYSKDIYAGFTNMQEIFILSMMIGGISALMKEQGGLAFVSGAIEKLIARFSGRSVQGMAAEFGIAAMAGLTNLCTANNTVSIIVTGGIARDLSLKEGVSAKRSASLLDIFSCVVQGLIPYGAQTLLACSILGVSPLQVFSCVYYCMLLAVVALVNIVVTGLRRQPERVVEGSR